MNDEETQQLIESHFKAQFKPPAWEWMAEIALRASEVLFEKSDVAQACHGDVENPDDQRLDEFATLLLGYALENGLKALILKRNPQLTIDQCFSISGWKSHGLAPLAKHAEFSTSSDDIFLLEELSKFIVWAGKG